MCNLVSQTAGCTVGTLLLTLSCLLSVIRCDVSFIELFFTFCLLSLSLSLCHCPPSVPIFLFCSHPQFVPAFMFCWPLFVILFHIFYLFLHLSLYIRSSLLPTFLVCCATLFLSSFFFSVYFCSFSLRVSRLLSFLCVSSSRSFSVVPIPSSAHPCPCI